MTRALRFLPYLGAITSIWLVSSMERPPVPEELSFWNSDKLLHMIAYAILAGTALFAVRRAAIAFPMAALYGVVDEIHQSFVPGRSSSWLDILADTLGAAIACAIFVFVVRRPPRA